MDIQPSIARTEVRAIPHRVGRPRLFKPLVLRLGDIQGLTPLRMFIVIALVAGLVSWWLRTPVATALNTAYAVAIINYVVRRHQRLLQRLRRQITLDDAHFRYEWYALARFRPGAMIGVGLLAPVALVAANWHSETLQAVLHGGEVTPEFVWSLALALLDWILIMQVFVIVASNAWRFHQLGSRHTRIDLLDTSGLSSYALAGIAVLVIFAGGYTVVPIAGLSSMQVLEAALRSLVVTLPIMVAGTLVPMLGVRHAIRSAKAREIGLLNRAIAGDRGALADTRIAAESGTVPLSNVVLYRQVVASVGEWPIDSLGAVRLAIVIAVPICAWIAGALADHLTDKLLG